MEQACARREPVSLACEWRQGAWRLDATWVPACRQTTPGSSVRSGSSRSTKRQAAGRYVGGSSSSRMASVRQHAATRTHTPRSPEQWVCIANRSIRQPVIFSTHIVSAHNTPPFWGKLPPKIACNIL